MSILPSRSWRVTVIEWLSHVALIEADTAEHAKEQALKLWPENDKHKAFSYCGSGLNEVVVEEDCVPALPGTYTRQYSPPS